jgi:hypothetical protein
VLILAYPILPKNDSKGFIKELFVKYESILRILLEHKKSLVDKFPRLGTSNFTKVVMKKRKKWPAF